MKNHRPKFDDESLSNFVIELVSDEKGPWTQVDNNMTAANILSIFSGIKYARLSCITGANEALLVVPKRSAFSMLMGSASQLILPKKKTSRFMNSTE